MSLQRFHEAQADPHAGYATALAELRRGRKSSHWIWYVFPQLAGLGHSDMAEKYAIRDLPEACDYLRDPVLRTRYEEITAAVCHQFARSIAVEDLMGSRIDAMKLVSSLTLFRAAAQTLAREDKSFDSLAQLCADALAQSRYQECSETLRQLANN